MRCPEEPPFPSLIRITARIRIVLRGPTCFDLGQNLHHSVL